MRKMPTTKQIDELQKMIDNGGGEGVFIAEYGTTTGVEIKAAIDAGKMVVLKGNLTISGPGTDTQFAIAPLNRTLNGKYKFEVATTAVSHGEGTYMVRSAYVNMTDTDASTWGSGLEWWSNQYLGTNIFVATVGTTTYTQLLDAYNSGDYDLFIAVSSDLIEYYEFYAKTNTAFVFKRIEQFNNNTQIAIHTLIFNNSYPTGSHTLKEYKTLPNVPDNTNNYHLVCKAGTISWELDN